LFREFAEPWTLAAALTNWGRVLPVARGDYAAAKRLHLESLEVALRWKDDAALGSITMNLGYLALLGEDYEAANVYHRQSLAWRRQQGKDFATSVSLFNLGDVACLKGDYHQAETLYGESLALWRANGYQDEVAYVLTAL